MLKKSSLELRLDELEKKYLDEKKSKDRKIKELENAVETKVNDEKIVITKKQFFKCKDCNFETCSKRGLNVHMKRKHTVLKMRNILGNMFFVTKLLKVKLN